jgi:kinesin family member 2/24
LEEEESLISKHRSHIDDIVAMVKDEMNLLNSVDKPGSDVQTYVQDLDKILLGKMSLISTLRE